MSDARTPLRVPSPPAAPAATCPVCGWTVDRLRSTGRMGCASCYRIFATLVAQAAAELHGAPVEAPPPSSAVPAPAEPEDLLAPWPTRRALKK